MEKLKIIRLKNAAPEFSDKAILIAINYYSDKDYHKNEEADLNETERKEAVQLLQNEAKNRDLKY